MDTPLLDALEAEVGCGRSSSHTPGHRGGRLRPAQLASWGQEIWRRDLTEIGDLDVLSQPTGVLAESQGLVAALHGAVAARYLVGGSTVGLLAALWALGHGETALVGRHAHPSIWHGLALAGARAVAIAPAMDEAWGVVHGLRLEDVQEAAAAHPEARLLVLTDPTYEGRLGENRRILAWAQEAGFRVVVDAAHGAHFPFHAGLPDLLRGDVVITSAHKMLPALTGTALLLVHDAHLLPAIDQALAMLQTSSPSYLLLASLEAAYAMMDAEGEAMIERGLARIAEARAALPARYRLAPTDDPLRWLIGGPAPAALSAALRRAGHNAETVSGEGLLLLHGLDGPAPGIVRTLTKIALPDAPPPRPALAPPVQAFLDPIAALAPPFVLRPLSEAAGAMLAQVLAPYPPGIPLGLPGERLTPAMQKAARSAGLSPATMLRTKGEDPLC